MDRNKINSKQMKCKLALEKTREKGITLVALIITIIIIIILSTITLSITLGDNGLINMAGQTKEDAEEFVNRESGKMEDLLEEYSNIMSEDSEIPEPEPEPDPLPEGAIIFGEVTWSGGVASVTISTSESGYTIQYQVNGTEEGKWSEISNGGEVTNLKHGDMVYGRITDGEQSSKAQSIQINDTIKPVVTVTSGGTTSNSVKVNVSAIDNESGMIDSPKYTYSIKVTGEDDSNYTAPSDASNLLTNTYTFTGLTQGTSYDIKVEVNGDKAGNTGIGYLTNQVTGKVPDAIEEGAITFGSVTWNSGKASVTINTKTSYTIQYQVNSTTGTWNVIGNGGAVNNLNHNDTVYARLYDGTNYGDYASVTIKDATKPTVSLSTSNITYNSAKVTVTASDGQTGLATSRTYKYYLNNSLKSTSTSNSYTFTGLSAETSYTIKVEVTDKAGNVGTATSTIKTAELPGIPENTSYVGYYADVDGNGSVDGIIYADLAFSKSGKWNTTGDSRMDSHGAYSYTKQNNLKEYKEEGTYTANGFGTKGVIKPNGESGNERFYVMALSNADTNEHYWYANAYDYEMDDYATYTSVNFGAGEENTKKMITKWNASGYGPQNSNDIWGDIWGLSVVQSGTWNGSSGWYVPSRGEWSAFGDAFNMTKSNYTSYGLSDYYWSSSQFDVNRSWYAIFFSGYMNDHRVDDRNSVRLGTTF